MKFHCPLEKMNDGRELSKVAEAGGAKPEWGKGDHKIERYNGSKEVFPQRPIGPGLAHKLVKWLKVTGLAKRAGVAILYAIAAALGILALAL